MKSENLFWLINDLTVVILLSMLVTAAIVWFLTSHGIHTGENLLSLVRKN